MADDLYTRVAAQTGMLRASVKQLAHELAYRPVHNDGEAAFVRIVQAIADQQRDLVGKMALLQERAEQEGWD